MTDEPRYLTEIKWPKKCGSCDVIVDKTGWLWHKQLYCDAHKPTEGATGGGVQLPTDTTSRSNANKEQPSVSHNDAKCDLCGQWYAGREGGMFYNAEHEAYRVCAFCQRVILCQAHAKTAGFWVVAKRPRTEEAKA